MTISGHWNPTSLFILRYNPSIYSISKDQQIYVKVSKEAQHKIKKAQARWGNLFISWYSSFNSDSIERQKMRQAILTSSNHLNYLPFVSIPCSQDLQHPCGIKRKKKQNKQQKNICSMKSKKQTQTGSVIEGFAPGEHLKIDSEMGNII